MNTKKILALAGFLLILGLGFGFAQQQNKTQKSSELKTWTLFIDEDGDGICDFARDHDNDGIPNRQDPDWNRPEDGTGLKNRFGQSEDNRFGNRNNFRGENGWNRMNFRQNRNNSGNPLGDSLGPKGKSNRRGGR